jgi:phytoene dehydrogenase-like protein
VTERDPDVVVIGSGPNGMVAACVLARRGLKVLVVEANPKRPGGALGSAELTLPGFLHDVGAGFFPFATSSPAFTELDLESLGLHFKNARFESCHPALDGTSASISTDLELSAKHFGSAADGVRWHKLCRFHAGIEERLLALLLQPFPSLKPLFKLSLVDALKLGSMFASSSGRLARRLFETPAAQRVLPSVAMHVLIGPEDWFSAGLAYMLGLTASTGGYAVPVGGAQRITDSLVTLLERHGGRLRLGSTVRRVLVSERRAVGVELADGTQIRARQAVVANTAAPALLLDLLERQYVPSSVVSKMQRFEYGPGTFKVDWALSAPVPWSVAEARESAVVHTGEDVDDLSRYTREVRSGKLPDNPYLVIGQHTLVDSSRAPLGGHTLYCYSRVPSEVEGGWAAQSEKLADRVEARIEGLAPGFRQTILARSIRTPSDLQRHNANLVGGDLGGGSNGWNHQLLFRPFFPCFRYRMPIQRLYLSSSYAHPGAGVHGMCGYNAAQALLHDVG